MPAASLQPSSARAAPSHLAAASTSSQRPAPLRRRGAVAVAAGDAMCRDVVGQRTERESSGKTFKLTFLAGDGQTREAVCADNEYILDAAEAANIDLPATCRGGICGACVARVAKGSTDMSDIPDLEFTVSEEEQAKGMTLLCMARATSDCEIEIQSDWGYSLGNEWKGATGAFEAKPVPMDPTKAQ